MNEIWRLQLFGGLRAQTADKTIERFRTRKTGALLAYLALHPQRTHSRDALIELFWPDSEPEAARTNLRVAINSLHRQFGWDGDALQSRHDGARLHPDAFVTDVGAFERALRDADRAGEPGLQRRCLRDALEVYGGRLLPHLYDDWAAQLQDRYAEQHLSALQQIIPLCEAAGDISAALDYAHCALAADAFCEPIHAALIRLHIQAQQPAMALRHYQEWERRLRDEFGETPGEDIRRLASALQNANNSGDSGNSGNSGENKDGSGKAVASLLNLPARSASPGGAVPASAGPLHGAFREDASRRSPRSAAAGAQHLSAERAPAARPAPLPVALTRFFGRLEERAALLALLQNGARLITLTGPGGSGKTRLALELAAHLQTLHSPSRRLPSEHPSEHHSEYRSEHPSQRQRDDETEHGPQHPAEHGPQHPAEHGPQHPAEHGPQYHIVCFVSLADVSEAGRIPAAIAAALGLPRRDSPDGPAHIAECLRERSALLILDNYEHLADTGALLARALLRDCPGLTCLVTSRQPLHLEGERQFPLSPLPLPAGTPERIKEFASVQLFVDRAQAVRPDFALTDRNAPHIAALCEKLEGVPLALELAAGWAGVLSPAQMLVRMERPFDLLVSRHKDISPRHRTLWGALEYSHRLLNADAQRVFACLAVFRGGCTLDAAQAVCGGSQVGALAPEATLNAVLRLQEHSLLGMAVHVQPPRCRMLESVRAFALEKLRASGDADGARERHAAFFLDRARQAFAAMSTPDQQAQFDDVEADMDNMRAVLEAPTDTQTALHLVSALGPFWSCRGYVQEGREHAARALERMDAPDFPPARARALVTAGNLANDRGDYPQAIASMEQARALYEGLCNREGALMCLCNLGRFLLNSAEHARARVLLSQALILSREQGLRSTEGYVLHNLGSLAARQGEWEASLEYHRQEQAIGDEMGDRHLLASSLNGMADNALGRGDLEQAREWYRRSLHGSSETGQRGSLHLPLTGLARIASAQGEWERAACLLGACGAISANTGMSLPPLEQAALSECREQARATLGDAEFARFCAPRWGTPNLRASARAVTPCRWRKP